MHQYVVIHTHMMIFTRASYIMAELEKTLVAINKGVALLKFVKIISAVQLLSRV